MANRATLYADPALADVNNNGGDRINKKTQQILRKLTDGMPGAEHAIKDAATAGKAKGRGGKKEGTVSPGKKKANGAGGSGSGTGSAGGSASSTPKKRNKIAKSDSEVDELADDVKDELERESE